MNWQLFNNSQARNWIDHFLLADLLIRILLIWQVVQLGNTFKKLQVVPEQYLQPITDFHALLMPNLPSPRLYFFVLAVISILIVLSTLFRNAIVAILLFLLLIWANSIHFLSGSITHGNTILYFYVLFTAFIPLIENYSNSQQKSQVIRWAYGGIFITYTMAGFWKFVGLAAKIVTQSNDINWLNSLAVEYNAIISLKVMNQSVSDTMMNIYELPLIWESLTLVTFFIQLIAITAIGNKKWFHFIGFCLIIIHIVNALLFEIHFRAATYFLVILCFPYHWFLPVGNLLNSESDKQKQKIRLEIE